MIRVKRVHDPLEPEDGPRFLVDRLWPRGIKKEDLPMDGWFRAVAPSDELRRWFGHEPAKSEVVSGRTAQGRSLTLGTINQFAGR